MIFLCLSVNGFLCCMDEPHQIMPYFSQGKKDVRPIFAKRCDLIQDVPSFIVPVALTCKTLHAQMGFSFCSQLVKDLACYHKKPQGSEIVLLNKKDENKKSKMQAVEEYAQLNRDVFLATCTKCFGQEALSRVISLFDKGADPNFSSLKFGTTPLMRAVCLNEPLFVQDLLKRNVDVHACDSEGYSARIFNMIYNSHTLEGFISPVADFMLKLETHNATNPQRPLICEEELFAEVDARELRKALWIDKVLEDKGAAFPLYSLEDHPLLILLGAKSKGPVIKRALRLMYSNNNNTITNLVPSMISDVLCDEGA